MNNPPLVLIHGYPFDHTMWYGVIAALDSGVRVFAPDLRGFGRHYHQDQNTPSLDLMADDIADLLAANGVDKAIVAGMSMGGYVALNFAERYPKRLAALGLISTQTGADSDSVKTSRREMIEKIKKLGPEVAAEALLPKLFAAANANNPDFNEFAVAGANRAGVEGLTWALEAMARRPDLTETVAQLELPILVLHGQEDQIIPLEKARLTAQSCKEQCLVQVRGAGHATPIEAPDAVAQALLRLTNTVRASDAEPPASKEGTTTLTKKS